MSLKNIFLAFIVFILIISCQTSEKKETVKKEEKASINLLNDSSSKEMDAWEGGPEWHGDFKFDKEKNLLTVNGISLTQSWGRIRRNLYFNIDKYPVLNLNVASCSNYWYLIALSEKFDEGYIRIQRDSSEKGSKKYYLKRLLNLKGNVKITLEVGISTNDELPTNDGCTAVFDKLELLKDDEQ